MSIHTDFKDAKLAAKNKAEEVEAKHQEYKDLAIVEQDTKLAVIEDIKGNFDNKPAGTYIRPVSGGPDKYAVVWNGEQITHIDFAEDV